MLSIPEAMSQPSSEHADTMTFVHAAVQSMSLTCVCCMQMLHRLDWCTTGVLVLGRTQAVGRRFMADMAAHHIRKQYKVCACITEIHLWRFERWRFKKSAAIAASTAYKCCRQIFCESFECIECTSEMHSALGSGA